MKFCYFFLFFISISSLFLSSTAKAASETVKFYANPGNAYVTTAPYPGSWLKQRSDTGGRIVLTNQENQGRVHSGAFQSSTGYLAIERAFLSFDTTSIPENAEITAANLNLYVAGTADDFDDPYGYVVVLKGNQSSTQTLVANDIDNCGDSLDNPLKGSQDIDISNVSVDNFESINLNQDGIGWITRGGETKLCLREGHDVENQEVVNNSSTWQSSIIRFFTADTADIGLWPYLEVTYELPDEPGADERPWLQTQIESPYPSVAETSEWADDWYAGATASSSYWCGSTIAGCGCAITSLAMAARDQGIETGVDGNEMNPGNLNSWLQSNQGYTSGGSVIWSRAADYFGTFTDEDEEEIETPVTLLDHRESSSTVIMNAVNDEDKFALAFNQSKGHFFVLDEALTDGYGIWDPLWYNTTTTNDAKNIASSTQDYNDTIARAVVYALEEAEVQTGVLELTADSPVELLLIDIDTNEQTGAGDSGTVEEVPSSSYSDDEFIGGPRTEETTDRPEHFAKKLIVTEASGEYLLRVTGTDAGNYILTVSMYTPDGEYQLVEFATETAPGSVAYYQINASTGEVVLVDDPVDEDIDRAAFLTVVKEATDDQRRYVQRFLMRMANKVFDRYEDGAVRHARVMLRVFARLVRVVHLDDESLDDAIKQLKKQFNEEMKH